jgi:hypothetical protein
MFPTSSIVKHVQKDDDHDRFYAQAEVTLTEDMDHAELQLRDVDSSVYAAPLMNAKAGLNTFHISGNESSPFTVGATIPVLCSLNRPTRTRVTMDRIAKMGWTFTMKCASIANSLFHRCLPVPEALTTGPSPAKSDVESDDMSPIPAKVLTVAKQHRSKLSEMPDPEWYLEQFRSHIGTIHELFKVCHPNDGRLYHGRLETHWQR